MLPNSTCLVEPCSRACVRTASTQKLNQVYPFTAEMLQYNDSCVSRVTFIHVALWVCINLLTVLLNSSIYSAQCSPTH